MGNENFDEAVKYLGEFFSKNEFNIYIERFIDITTDIHGDVVVTARLINRNELKFVVSSKQKIIHVSVPDVGKSVILLHSAIRVAFGFKEFFRTFIDKYSKKTNKEGDNILIILELYLQYFKYHRDNGLTYDQINDVYMKSEISDMMIRIEGYNKMKECKEIFAKFGFNLFND